MSLREIRDTPLGTFTIAASLCVVCSILVSAFAVGLRPIQKTNEQVAFQREVLTVAGLYDPKTSDPSEIPELFSQVEPFLININEAEIADTDKVDIESFDLKKVAANEELSIELPPGEDIAGIGRREIYTKIYLVKKENGALDQIILPVRAMGLWGTMWGLLSLDSDTKTVRGLTFYDDKETPGLGAEINNASWKNSWSNPNCPKVLFDEQGDVQIGFYKGAVNCEMDDSEHKFEALAGATITTRGVENMMKYWLSEDVYGPLLEKVRAGNFPKTEVSSL